MSLISSQRGVSLVAMMVGLAIGLAISAASATLLGATLRETRSASLERRLMQDLRTAADIVSRDLRRAGYWGDAGAGVRSAGDAGVRSNPYAALAPAAAASDAAAFRYSRDAAENHAVDSHEQFGFRLRRGVIEMQLGAANWQALTDAGTLFVTEFHITPQVQAVALQAACARPCPAGDATCPPRLEVRSLALALAARAAADPAVQRHLVSELRLRNDGVVGACPT